MMISLPEMRSSSGLVPIAWDRVKRFGEAVGTPFDLGSDAAGEIRRLFDVERRFGLGTSRVTYVIDGDGVIRRAFHDEFRVASHVQYALRALESLA